MTDVRDQERKERILAWMQSNGMIDPECPGCKAFYDAPDPSAVFAPSHKASRACQSGGKPHCTCDWCF